MSKTRLAPAKQVLKGASLSRQQFGSLLDLWATDPAAVHLEQTHTDSGGEHLYAEVGDRLFHIAQDGSATELDTQ